MPDKSDDEELLEDSEYSRKSEFSKAIITQTQISKCLELRSKDMRPGYTTWIQDSKGELKPNIVPDSRKEFVSSMEALKNLLSPEIKLKMPDLNEQYNDAKKEVFDKYAYKEKISKKLVNGKPTWIYSDRVFMPQKGQPIMCNNDKPKSLGVSFNPHGWDIMIDAYWDELVYIADELFAELNNLIHKLDYFKAETGF